MLAKSIQDIIKGDFEKMLAYLQANKRNFGFDSFGAYAVSILNFYVGSKIITLADKKKAALYLCKLYNAGLKNIISAADLEEMSEFISADPSLDYQVLQPIFN